jgi:hypothetical protein
VDSPGSILTTVAWIGLFHADVKLFASEDEGWFLVRDERCNEDQRCKGQKQTQTLSGLHFFFFFEFLGQLAR